MNIRIKELVERAEDYANSQYIHPVRSKEPGMVWETGHIGWNEIFQNKFAELIITECIYVVKVWSEEEPCSEGYDITTVGKIKTHFGVK